MEQKTMIDLEQVEKLISYFGQMVEEDRDVFMKTAKTFAFVGNVKRETIRQLRNEINELESL